MDKMRLREILRDKLLAAKEKDADLGTQEQIAARAGLSQTHISRLLKCEASATTDALCGLARALKCEPWELLLDDDEVRKAVLQRILGG